MSGKITKVEPRWHGHLFLQFEDGSNVVIHRGEHEQHGLKVGDYWPPVPVRNPEPEPIKVEPIPDPEPLPEPTPAADPVINLEVTDVPMDEKASQETTVEG